MRWYRDTVSELAREKQLLTNNLEWLLVSLRKIKWCHWLTDTDWPVFVWLPSFSDPEEKSLSSFWTEKYLLKWWLKTGNAGAGGRVSLTYDGRRKTVWHCNCSLRMPEVDRPNWGHQEEEVHTWCQLARPLTASIQPDIQPDPYKAALLTARVEIVTDQ